MKHARSKGFPELETGVDAAMRFASRRKIHAGRGSSLKKLQRFLNIQAGLRPCCFGDPDKRSPRTLRYFATKFGRRG